MPKEFWESLRKNRTRRTSILEDVEKSCANKRLNFDIPNKEAANFVVTAILIQDGHTNLPFVQ